VLLRLSHSHIRIGTFQRLAFLADNAAIERLLGYSIDNYFPELADAPTERRAASFLEAVAERVAGLAASYMASGFVHGVLNSDNINITGESFDYGPWRFAPVWDAGFTAAYFDQTGLYAFGRQPGALAWNLTRLAECLLPLTGLSAAEKALDAYPELARAAFRKAVVERLGLLSEGEEADARLAKAFVDFLMASRAPFEQTLFDWRGGVASEARAKRSPSAAIYEAEHFAPLRETLDAYRPSPTARLDHRYFAQAEPCTMLIDEMEAIWSAIAERDDWSLLAEKLARIAEMREANTGE
jgi:uncharacterized protein YdiU (UPF0061 family)